MRMKMLVFNVITTRQLKQFLYNWRENTTRNAFA